MLRHRLEGRRFFLHHVRVELRRTTDRLARVVDDEVQPAARGEQLAAERLHAPRVAQIEPEDLEAGRPLLEVRFPRRSAPPNCAGNRVVTMSVRAGAQQLEAGLIANLDPRRR